MERILLVFPPVLRVLIQNSIQQYIKQRSLLPVLNANVFYALPQFVAYTTNRLTSDVIEEMIKNNECELDVVQKVKNVLRNNQRKEEKII